MSKRLIPAPARVTRLRDRKGAASAQWRAFPVAGDAAAEGAVEMLEAAMGAQDNPFEAGLERWKALMTWRGLPNAEPGTAGADQMQRFQAFVFDLQKTLTDTSGRELDALFALNQKIAGLLQQLLQPRQPQDVFTILTDIQAAMLEGGLSQAKAWTDLARQMQEQFVALSRVERDEPGAEAGSAEHRAESHSVKPAARTKMSAGFGD